MVSKNICWVFCRVIGGGLKTLAGLLGQVGLAMATTGMQKSNRQIQMEICEGVPGQPVCRSGQSASPLLQMQRHQRGSKLSKSHISIAVSKRCCIKGRFPSALCITICIRNSKSPSYSTISRMHCTGINQDISKWVLAMAVQQW